MAISGIDIPQWDLKDKILGARVLELLRGPVRDKLPAIANIHATKADLAEQDEEIAAHTATGLHGAKVGFGKAGAPISASSARDLEFIRRTSEAMGPGSR